MDQDKREPWAVQAGAEKILAAEDMRDYAIFALDAEGHVASWNEGAARLKGYTSDEVIGSHFSRFYPPDQVATGYPDWELRQASENGFFIDRGWRVRKDGSRYWAHVVIAAQRTPAGELDGFIKVVRNESEASARVERTRRRLADLFEIAPAGIALLDDRGRFLDANGALCDLLDRRLEDLVGLRDVEVLDPTDTGGGLVDGDTRSTGDLLVPHRLLARADGTPVPCQVRAAASVRDDGSRSWLITFHDITEQLARAMTLRHQATHDDLTGLLNRRGFQERLAEMLPPDKPGSVAVLFCDLHNFKRINDALGHEAGDELLSEVAERLLEGLPERCEAARFYGDEFVILCRDLDGAADLESITESVAELFRMTVPLRGRHVQVTASIGVKAVEDSGVDVVSLLRSAESAMLDARVRGQTRGGGHDQLALEEELREAIAGGEIDLHYQPVVDNDGTVVIAEALLRWTHPDLGPLTPDVVLAIASRGGMLADLDTCVLRTALREARSWRRRDGGAVKVSVNLTGLRPEQPGFAEVVRSVLAETGAAPDILVLEMVETVFAQLEPEQRQEMNDLVADGVQFAVDDFGTGYSSLAVLKELPTQVIKLDRMFVSGVGEDPDDLGIARAMTELARTLGRMCIAEGVETSTQHQLLRAVSVDAYQGYYFSRPIPPAEFRAYLAGS
ncbi:putative bifunctional diguanylate cyclase/phosphodiesterase [Saccharopolyspora flava]|uniref:PAS domain S-box-containing protein/diguanylate cyclase (GGDEF) domain-containing protein n=1 Tax=Saccharopolyspora flava TaxID=95161 RepID=A0A1I6QSY8_9PSEU|nr:EAL domain-containing protein [Saccharopolyspora flava]SFS55585.1 PAS domain S-box-containing protein/diguanylate cyclase (GGDEF) domain-containing protein [Saccharopolyspora flava]